MSRFEQGENIGAEADSEISAAQGAAVGTRFGNLDDDLKAIIERWPQLPAGMKAGILAMIRASGD